MAAPIRDAQGKTIGALVGVVNLAESNFLDEITGNNYGQSGGYLLVDPMLRMIVTASDHSRIMETAPAPGLYPLIDRFLEGYEGSGVILNPHGVEVLTAAKNIPLAGWFVAVSLPTAEAFAPILAMQRRMCAATILLTLLAGGITWWMLRRQLAPMLSTAKNLAVLSDVSQHPQPLPVTSQDEIGQLIGGFNLLLEALGKRDEALRESEGRFKKIAQWLPGIVFQFRLRPDGGVCLPYASDALRDIYRISPEEVREDASKVFDPVHPDDLEAFKASIPASARDLAPWRQEFRLRFDDGAERWLFGNALPQREADGGTLWHGFITDITEHKQTGAERERTIQFLELLSTSSTRRELLRQALPLLKDWLQCDAIGVRMLDEQDCPYYETSGFSSEFVRKDNLLCMLDEHGKPRRDSAGKPLLDCMCGHVLCGRFDKSLPFFTPHGSFRTHSTSEMLAGGEQDPWRLTRRDCNRAGYESVVLIPLRAGGENLGLLQCNSLRKNAFNNDTIAMIERLSGSLAIALAQRLTVEAIQAEHNRAQQYLDVAGAILVGLDKDQTINLINKKGCALLGHTQEDLIGKNWFKLILPAHERERVRGLFERLMAGAVAPEEFHDNYVVTRGGKERLIRWHNVLVKDAGGNITGTLSAGEDITSRKRAEEQIRESEDKYRHLFNLESDAIFLIDVETDRILEVNDGVTASYGHTREELLTNMKGADISADPAGPRQPFVEGKTLIPLRMHRKKDGTVFPVEISESFFVWRGRRMHIAAVRDITERKKTEQEFMRYQTQLRSMASQLSMVEERERRRLANIIHDSMGQMLAMCLLQLGKAQTAIAGTETAAIIGKVRENLKKITQDTRSLVFELSPPVLYEFGLEAALKALAVNFQEQSGIQCVFEFQGAAQPVSSDLGALVYRAARELLVNAVKHSKAQNITLLYFQNVDALCVTVRDNGVGWSLETAGNTPGFGLFNLRERLRHIGGQLDIQSSPGQGCRATVVVNMKSHPDLRGGI
jgi:PAS domain S-box-containing protein